MNREDTSKAADVVAIYRAEDMTQVLERLRPLAANVNEAVNLMDHPLEDGTVITDHLVRLPADVEFPMLVNAEDIPSVVDEARELMEGGHLLTVQTRRGSVFNMVLLAIPTEERPEALDAPLMLLRMRQAQFVTPEYGSIPPARASRPAQASTKARGQQQNRPARNANAASAPEQRGSTLYRAFKGGGG